MNITKLLTGIIRLISLFIVGFVTLPILLVLICYDMGDPQDDKDRAITFLDKIFDMLGIK